MKFCQDEDIYTFFEPELDPVGPVGPTTGRAKIANPLNRFALNSTGASALTSCKAPPHSETTRANWWSRMREKMMTVHEGSSVLDLRGENYFSCAVGRKRSNARYLIGSSSEVVSLLKELADCQQSNFAFR